MMKKLLITLTTLLITANAAFADGQIIVKDETISAFIRSDRDSRSWKTLFLLPGKENRWFYSFLDKDGHSYVRETTGRMDGVRDMRPLEDSNPNLAILRNLFGGATSNVVSGAAGGLLVMP